ncbi:MAG: SAM hydroxide adenosyltransferase [bacterium]
MITYTCATIINDCRDSATANREISRVTALTGIHPSFVGINDFADLEGAGNIIDTLDAFTGMPGIIIANAAPRHGKGKKYPNGTPFCYFCVGETLVISSIQGSMLSLIKKLRLSRALNLVDIPTVCDAMVANGKLTSAQANQIAGSQYRSFDFEPRLAGWLVDGLTIPSSTHSFDTFAEIEDLGHVVWLVDNFGNCKTTILPEEIGFEEGKKIQTHFGLATMYRQLRSVPDGELALTTGSSGYGADRFIELVIQGQSAAKKYGIEVGTKIL